MPLHRWFSNRKLLHKILVPVFLLLIVMGSVVWTARSAISELTGSTARITDLVADRLGAAIAVQSALGDAMDTEANAIVAPSREAIDAADAQLKADIAKATAAIDTLAAAYDDPAQRESIQAIKSIVAEYERIARTSVDLARVFDTDGAIRVSIDVGRPVRQKLTAALDERVEQSMAETREAERRATALSEQVMTRLYVVAGAGLLFAFGLLGSIVLVFVVRPLNRLTSEMTSIAAGDLTIAIQGTERSDEVGLLARALQVFKSNGLDMRRLQEESDAQKRRMEDDRRAAMLALADQFDANVQGVVQAVALAARQLQSNAQTMTDAAETTTEQASSVAAASEQLGSSIGEIGRQVNGAATVARDAVVEGERTNALVEQLSTAAQKIGDVVNLIQNIASQTNLLALNATIEAARAGESGKGFAVVAGEVKALATQTSQATEEIASQITEIQAITEGTVTAIRKIARTIADVDTIAGTIAAAVEEQTAATHEIGRNIQQAAQGTRLVSGNIGGVSRSATDVREAAAEVLDAATGLSRDSDLLRDEIQGFIARVRAG